MLKAILGFLVTTIATAIGRKVKEKIARKPKNNYAGGCEDKDCDICYEDEDRK